MPVSFDIKKTNRLSSQKRWRVFYTSPRAEKKCEQRLREQEIEVFLPKIITLRQWKDRKKHIEAPLFPSYLFTHIDESERLRVLQTDGIVRCLSFGTNLAEVSASEIEQLKITQHNPKKLALLGHRIPAIGRQVKVIAGPFHGLQGEVLEHRGQMYIVIRVDALRQAVKVNVPAQCVRPLPERPLAKSA